LFGDGGERVYHEVQGHDEAQEDNELEENDGNRGSDEESGEDIMEHMEQDYENRPELDQYELAGIDDEAQNELPMNERMQIDQDLDRQERANQLRGRRIPGAFMDEEMEQSDDQMVAQQLAREITKRNR